MKHFFADKDLNFNLLDSSKFLREILRKNVQEGKTQVAQVMTEEKNADVDPSDANPPLSTLTLPSLKVLFILLINSSFVFYKYLIYFYEHLV